MREVLTSIGEALRRGPCPDLWPVVLEHDAITVRPVRPSDVKAWAYARQRNAHWLEEWDATAPPESAEPVASYAGSVRRQLAAARRGQALPFVVEVDGYFAGQVTVSNVVYGSAYFASVGYWIDQAYAGQGVIPRAVALVIDHCLTAGLHRIEISIRPENVNSLRVVEKLELAQVGYSPRYLHIDGQWADHLNFAITAEELPPGGLITRVT